MFRTRAATCTMTEPSVDLINNGMSAVRAGLLGRLLGRRSYRVLAALAAVWVLSCFDLTLTIWAQADGVLDEQNPVARFLLAYGPGAVLAFKLATLSVASFVMYHYRAQRFTERALLVVLVAYAVVAIQWRLCYSMYEITHTGGALSAELAQFDTWFTYLPNL
jgi:hypothetical protein